MIQRRVPRAFAQLEGEDTDQQFPGASPALIEYLERTFTVSLSPIPGMGDNITAEDTVAHQARMTGQQEVLDLLRKLSKREA